MSDDIKHKLVLDKIQSGIPAYKAYQEVYKCDEKSALSNAYRIFKMENDGMKQALKDVGLDSYTIASEIQNMVSSKNDKRAGVELALKINGAFAPTKSEVKAEITGISSILDELDK